MKRVVLIISLIGIVILGIRLFFFLIGQFLPIPLLPQSSPTGQQPLATIEHDEADAMLPDEHGETAAPVGSFSHGHGMAVDIKDSSKLYIGTHYGVYVLRNDTTLSKLGNSEDDFMGFTVHPSLPAVQFASGHPKTGGNLGVLRSDDSGVTWKKLAQGVGGPVDFHALAISPVNPNLMYGWHDGLQRSEDAGQSWKKIPTMLDPAYRLVAHPSEEQTLFAANGSGLWVSRDRGETWGVVADVFKKSAVFAFAINLKKPTDMLSYGTAAKLAKSTDGGRTWKTISQDVGGDVVYLFAYDPNVATTVYALTKTNLLFKSIDDGGTWRQLSL